MIGHRCIVFKVEIFPVISELESQLYEWIHMELKEVICQVLFSRKLQNTQFKNPLI